MSAADDTHSGSEPLVPISVVADDPSEVVEVGSPGPGMIKVPASAVSPSKTSPGVQKITPFNTPKASTGQTQPPTAAPRPVINPGSTVPPGSGVQKIAPVTQAVPKPTPQPTVQPANKTFTELKTGQTTVGGISPAVAYLQSVKTQLEHLDKEMKSVKDQISQVTLSQELQFGAIIKRLDELKGETKTQTAPVAKSEPAPAPAPKPASTPSQTSAPSGTPPKTAAPENSGAPEASAPDPTSPPSRKGPVWPV